MNFICKKPSVVITLAGYPSVTLANLPLILILVAQPPFILSPRSLPAPDGSTSRFPNPRLIPIPRPRYLRSLRVITQYRVGTCKLLSKPLSARLPRSNSRANSRHYLWGTRARHTRAISRVRPVPVSRAHRWENVSQEEAHLAASKGTLPTSRHAISTYKVQRASYTCTVCTLPMTNYRPW